MTLPVWMLLGFATWTLILLIATVGIYRWSRILTRRADLKEFRADHVVGEDWYKRAMRAHANCVENLPVFAVIVFALHVAGLGGATVNVLVVAILAARVVQSFVHVCCPQTNISVAVRFSFFFVQIIGFFWLIAIIVLQHADGA